MYEMLSKQSSLFEWLGNDPLSICLSLCLRIHLFKFLFYINFFIRMDFLPACTSVQHLHAWCMHG